MCCCCMLLLWLLRAVLGLGCRAEAALRFLRPHPTHWQVPAGSRQPTAAASWAVSSLVVALRQQQTPKQRAMAVRRRGIVTSIPSRSGVGRGRLSWQWWEWTHSGSGHIARQPWLWLAAT